MEWKTFQNQGSWKSGQAKLHSIWTAPLTLKSHWSKIQICNISWLEVLISCVFYTVTLYFLWSWVGTEMNHLITFCFCPLQPFFIYLSLSVYLTYHPPFLSLSARSPFWVLNRLFLLLFSCSLPFCFSRSSNISHCQNSKFKQLYPVHGDLLSYRIQTLTVWALNELVNICPTVAACF